MIDAPAFLSPLIARSGVVHILLGFALGLLYFEGLWCVVQRIAADKPPALTFIITLSRLVIVPAILFQVSQEGPALLLATALGLIGARFATISRVRGVE